MFGDQKVKEEKEPKPDIEIPSLFFNDVQVKPIKNVEGWSGISFTINERRYRLDMEDEFAQELAKRLL